MAEQAIKLGGKKQSTFIDKVKKLLPEGGNLNLCLTCGACSSGCPATGLEGMDPRKFLRMAALGMDEEITKTPWVWMCSMCTRCVYVCPMKINIPQLVFYARQTWPRDQRPKASWVPATWPCATTPAAPWAPPKRTSSSWSRTCWPSTRRPSPNSPKWKCPSTKKAPCSFLNQNSREPVTEPDEMVPLWKILHLAGADWTYGTKGWAAENYCMFLADDENWKRSSNQGQGGGGPGLQGLAQHGVRARTLRGPVRTAKIRDQGQLRIKSIIQLLCPVDP
jgi:ferredoxin